MLYEISERVMRMQMQGRQMIKLNVGDPDQQTDSRIVQATADAIKSSGTKYGSAAGLIQLREALAQQYSVKTENVLITPGAKWAVFCSLSLLLKDGGNVIIPSPFWTAYPLMVSQLGGKVKVLETSIENDWKLDIGRLEELIDSETKAIILNSPNNPTSKCINPSDINEILAMAARKSVMVIADQTYSELCFSGRQSKPAIQQGCMVAGSFSKAFAMTGFRVGYLIAGSRQCDQLIKLSQITFNNVPVFAQAGALKAMELREQITSEMRGIYKKRLGLAIKMLSSSGLEFCKPDAAFYMFLRAKGQDCEKLALNLLEKGVAIAPGTAFGNFRDFFRISLTAPENDIKVGLEKIMEALK